MTICRPDYPVIVGVFSVVMMAVNLSQFSRQPRRVVSQLPAGNQPAA
jgi:hypothetical protein